MSDELVFYTNPMSRGRIVRWMLEEVGQPYRTEVLEYGTTMKAPAYLAINPMGKVPAIRHGDTVVTEAAAICAYLADAFPQARLAPAARRSAARPLLSLAVLRRRPGRGGGDQQGGGPHGAAGTRADDGLRQLHRYDERAGGRGLPRRLPGGRQLHRRRPLCRIADRLGADVRHDRKARRLHAVLGPPQRAAGGTARKADRRRAGAEKGRGSGLLAYLPMAAL